MLSEAELLAIFLRVGVKGSSALARQMLKRYGSLKALLSRASSRTRSRWWTSG